ncbi:endolytic transglycosylase MltG [Streptomyces sp. MS06]|uniref:endolytic transglycosylase MltG n=1 Tax=Streptomyces sp. MS06 TaxID=3385974 RepID=UPI0039A2D30C
MTEYGRGEGPDPWHPDDPLYGDGGWSGQQPHMGHQHAYGAPQQPDPQQPYAPQQNSYDGWGQDPGGGYDAQYRHPQQTYQHDQRQYQHDQQQYQQPHQGGQQYQQPQQYQQQYYAQSPQQAQQQYQQYYGEPSAEPQYQQGGWDGSGTYAQVRYPDDSGDPYGQQAMAHGGEQPDYYRTADAYPPPEPPARRRPEPEPRPDWDPDPDAAEHAFAEGDPDGDGEDADGEDADRERLPEDGEPGSRRARGKGAKDGKGRKRRSGCACLVVLLVFGGGLGGVGYVGFKYFQGRFGAAPDYAGDGNGEMVTVEIPKGAGGYVIGRKLKAAGVVKSVDAFVAAQQENPKGKTIQDGIYTLQKQMSAASAVALMLSPKSRDNLIIPEGKRNSWVYAAIDKRLKLADGTTRKIAQKDWKDLGLPSWANDDKDIKDPLEGFLYPSSYAVAKGMKPEDVLKQMVARATKQYGQYDLQGKAKELGLDGPLQVITVASLVQAEGKYKHDFDKVARVVYNRLQPDNRETVGRLEFDSTINYLKDQSTLDVGRVADLRKVKDPYNTYSIKGLTPGPIDNPGKQALESALKPATGPWYYFVSINEEKTVFSKTYAEHQKNVAEYEKERKQAQQ